LLKKFTPRFSLKSAAFLPPATQFFRCGFFIINFSVFTPPLTASPFSDDVLGVGYKVQP